MLWLLIIPGYLAGSIPFGLLLGKLRGLDIREKGSGNIGTTNVFRILGRKAGIFCLVLDVLKGFLPVFWAHQLVPDNLTGDSIEVLTAFATIMGHNYSPWIGFKGGKGIATTGGALLALAPFAVLVLVVIFVIVTLTTKYVSLGSIAAGIALPLLTLFGSYHHGKIADGTWNKPLFVFSLVAGTLAVWKHRSNLARLRAGTEHRLGQKKKEATS